MRNFRVNWIFLYRQEYRRPPYPTKNRLVYWITRFLAEVPVCIEREQKSPGILCSIQEEPVDALKKETLNVVSSGTLRIADRLLEVVNFTLEEVCLDAPQ